MSILRRNTTEAWVRAHDMQLNYLASAHLLLCVLHFPVLFCFILFVSFFKKKQNMLDTACTNIQTNLSPS